MDEQLPLENGERKFSQEELKRAYAQIVEEREADGRAARRAAAQLKLLIQQEVHVECGMLWCMDRFHRHITPEPSVFRLTLYLCDYDNWQAVLDRLERAGVKMLPWDGSYRNMPQGSWAASDGQTYGVHIQYYNSHDGECTT